MSARNRTKATSPCANIAQNHERGSLLRITFHTIRTFGIFTNRFQSKLLEQMRRKMVRITMGNLSLQPSRQPPSSIGDDLNGILVQDGQFRYARKFVGIHICRNACLQPIRRTLAQHEFFQRNKKKPLVYDRGLNYNNNTCRFDFTRS